MSTIDRIRDLSAQADGLKAALVDARAAYEKVKAFGGQRGYSVVIDGVRVDVATIDHRTYMPRLIRGMDMVHLGVLKSLDARVDAARARLAAKAQEVAEAAAEMAEHLKKGGAA